MSFHIKEATQYVRLAIRPETETEKNKEETVFINKVM